MIRLGVSGLSAAYGRTRVLHDVALPDLHDGQLLGLLGPNASGKSTAMHCLARQMKADGEIRIDGDPVSDIPHATWLRKVAIVPQSPPAPTSLTPTELLWSAVRALDLALSDRSLAARIQDIFAELGLSELAFAPLHTLSGGKRQLVGIALALVRDPQIVLLDEPTSALDLYWRLTVLDLVRSRLARQGGAAVIALHDMDLAARYCDQVALLSNGRVVAAGLPAEVMTPDNLASVYGVEAKTRMGEDGRVTINVLRPIGAP